MGAILPIAADRALQYAVRMLLKPVERLITSICATALLAGCSEPREPGEAGADSVGNLAKESLADSDFASRWEELIEEARREGEIVVAGSSSIRRNRPVLDEFSRRFGIEVIASSGTGSTVVRRILVERSRGLFTADIVMVGGTSSRQLLGANAVAPMEPLFIHPEVVDRTTGWLTPEYAWNGAKAGYCAAYRLGIKENLTDIYYNTDKVDEEEINRVQSFQDLLDPRWKGRMVSILDPDNPSSLYEWALSWRVLGKAWFEPFIRNLEPTLLPGASTRELADGLARGKYDFGIFVGRAGGDLDKMAAIGLPVLKLKRTLDEGPALQTGGSISVLDRAPHPRAAQLFVNWFLSREGQNFRNTFVADENPEPSLRTDVVQGKVSDA